MFLAVENGSHHVTIATTPITSLSHRVGVEVGFEHGAKSIAQSAQGLEQKINDRTLDAMVHFGNEFLQQRATLPGYQPIYGPPVVILLSGPADVKKR